MRDTATGKPLNSTATSMAIDHGDIVLGGFTGGHRIALARFRPDGGLRTRFAHGGTETRVLNHLASIQTLAIDAKGKIVAAGRTKRDANTVWALARFEPDGSVDHSFGDCGDLATTLPGDRRVDAHAVAIDSRNRIVVAGAPGFSLVRYQPNGNVNRAFGHRGKVREDFGFGSARGLAIDSKDRPVAVGAAKRRFAVARFLG